MLDERISLIEVPPLLWLRIFAAMELRFVSKQTTYFTTVDHHNDGAKQYSIM